MIRVAFAELLTFLLMMFIIMTGFAFTAFLSFGATVDGFYSPIRALVTLFQFSLGEFQLEPMLDDNHWFAVAFFVVFIVVIVFIVLSMFIAIVSDAYNVVRDDLAQVRGTSLLALLWLKVGTKLARLPLVRACFQRKKQHRVNDLAADLSANADLDRNEYWTREEVERVLRRHAASASLAGQEKDLFSAFDVDGSTGLDHAEQALLLDYLRRKAIDPNTPLPSIKRVRQADVTRAAVQAHGMAHAQPSTAAGVESQLQLLVAAVRQMQTQLDKLTAAQHSQQQQQWQQQEAPAAARGIAASPSTGGGLGTRERKLPNVAASERSRQPNVSSSRRA